MSILGSISRLARRRPVAIALALLLVIETSCSNRRLTKANVDEVVEGMSKKQVESILGPPTSVDNADFVVMKKITYLYRQENGNVTVIFKDDKVTEKQTTLSE
jgi:outer membrane protein assembly factor BamE (lipoprotein component of BamABCDE complex)